MLVFRNRNTGYFSIGCFHECKISLDFAIIGFCQNTQLKKYCIWFLRRKMLETRLGRSSHKIVIIIKNNNNNNNNKNNNNNNNSNNNNNNNNNRYNKNENDNLATNDYEKSYHNNTNDLR